MLPGMSPSLPPTSSKANADSNLIDDIDRFELWFSTNWGWLWRGAVAIVVIVTVYVGYSMVTSYSETAASESFNAVTLDKKMTNQDKIKAFAKLIQENPSAAASVIPRFDVAADEVEKGKYEAAQALYEGVLTSKTAPDVLKIRASANLAYLLEIQGKTAEALSAFREIQNQYTDQMNTQFVIEIQCAVSRLLAAEGQTAEALDALKILTENQQGADLQNSPFSYIVNRRMQILSAKQAQNMGANLGANPSGRIGADLSTVGANAAVQPASDSK